MEKEIKTEYLKESAGRVMVPKEELPVFLQNEKISEIKREFQEKLKFYEICDYIYFVDGEGKLVGVLSERELFGAKFDVEAKEIMQKRVIKVESHTDQERVAILAIDHYLEAIPVVDKENKFLGVVTARSIFHILHHEHVEDFLKSAGIHSLSAQTLTASASFLTKVRIPWLILGLFGGLLAAKLIGFFETSLKEHFILAAFIPLMVYLASAIGIQTQTLFIRHLVMRKINLKKYILKEIKVGLGISLILGILLFLITFIWLNGFVIGLILVLSMLLTGMAAVFIPILTIFLLSKFKKDPAIAAGPFATIVQDITTIAIYCSVAFILLKIFT